MNEIWDRVLANSFSGIHKSKIICSALQVAAPIFLWQSPDHLPRSYSSALQVAAPIFIWRSPEVACSVFMLAQPMHHSFAHAVQVAFSVFMLAQPMQIHSLYGTVQLLKLAQVLILAHSRQLLQSFSCAVRTVRVASTFLIWEIWVDYSVFFYSRPVQVQQLPFL